MVFANETMLTLQLRFQSHNENEGIRTDELEDIVELHLDPRNKDDFP